MKTKPREDTLGDVIARNTPCQLLDRDGLPCGKPGMAGLPVGCCQLHAIAITRAVLKAGGIRIETRRSA